MADGAGAVRAPGWARLRLGLLLVGLAGSLPGAVAAGPIDDARLAGADGEASDWLLPGRDYGGQRFSPLDRIDVGNVGRLVPKWIYQTGVAATFQTQPLVADGRMYLSAPGAHVIALDAATGRELWRYTHVARAKLCCGPANRGVALGYGRVYVAGVDARLVALDQNDGRVLWDVPMVQAGEAASVGEDDRAVAADPGMRGTASGATGLGANAAPLVHGGLVIVGVTGVGYGLHLDADRPGAPLGAVVGVAGRYGRPGFLAAYDAATGRPVWRFDATRPGWEGAFVARTAYGADLHRDVDAERASAAENAEAWRTGGGSIWHAPVLDVATGLLFLGIGNPSPQAAGESRPGDNLHTSSLVALDARDGRLVWHYQQVPHDLWGYDVASPPVLFDAVVEGRRVPAVGQASKLGWYFVHARDDGRLLYRSDAFVPQENLFRPPTPEGIRIAPGIGGGVNWSPTSLDPATGTVYLAAMHWPSTYRAREIPAAGGKPAVRYFSVEPETGGERYGVVAALDLDAGGRLRWQHRTAEPLVGGVLATRGGLVFTGEGDGHLTALSAADGRRLWRFNCGAGVNAPPMSYAVDGRQFVAVAAGGSQLWGFRQGDAVIAFGLPDER